MFCRKRNRVVLRGMAAFLLLVMLGSSVAFGTETPAGSDESAGGTEAAEESEAVSTVNLEGKDEAGEEAVEEIAEENDVLLFSQTEQVTDKTVLLYYNKTIKYESYKTHDFHVICDDEKILAYCIDPAVNWGGKKKYTAKPYDDVLMTKALYYCYGNPGYDRMKEYLSGVERKSCYEGDDGAYALCHIMLSYIYDGEKGNGDAFKGCSSETRKIVKNLLAEIKTWPDPPGQTELKLSTETVKAEWDEDNDVQVTPDIKVTGTEGNSVDIPVPDGATLVCGSESVSSGSRTVKVDESFHFTAPDTVQEDYQSPELEASLKSFQPYLISPKGKQNEIFSISTASYVSFSITWEDFGSVKLTKTSADESVTEGNEDYSLNGAKYELYSKESGKSHGTFVTGENGEASLENIPYGEYYVKETQAPKGYDIDKSSHDLTVASETGSIEVSDKPLVKSAAEEEDESKSDEMPKTGDSTMLLLLLAGIGISMLFGAVALVTRN